MTETFLQKQVEQFKENIRLERTKERQQRLEKDRTKDEQNYKQYEEKYFSSLKNLVTLAGTIFASSIALSAGKNVNHWFFSGEALLLISILSGIILLLNKLRFYEWQSAFEAKNKLELDLSLNSDIIEDFEKKITKDLIDIYSMTINKKSYVNYITEFVHYRTIEIVFYSHLFFGIVLLLFSIIPQ